MSGGGGRERLRRCEHRPPSAPRSLARSLAGSAGPERGRAGAGGGVEGADVARRLRSLRDPEGGGSDSAGYSLTPRAERSPELTWLPGAAWVTELPKSPRQRRGWPAMCGGRRPESGCPGSRPQTPRPHFGRRSGRTPASSPIPRVGRSPHRARPTARGEAAWRLGRDGAGWTLQHAKSCQLLEIKTLIRNGWLEHSAPS